METRTDEKTIKLQMLKHKLKDSLHEVVTINAHHHGMKTFTIGKFLDNQIVCTACKSETPLWLEDQLVYPVMKSLIKLVAQEEKERIEAQAEKEAS